MNKKFARTDFCRAGFSSNLDIRRIETSNLRAVLTNGCNISVPQTPNLAAKLLLLPLWSGDNSFYFAEKLNSCLLRQSEELEISVQGGYAQTFLISEATTDRIEICV